MNLLGWGRLWVVAVIAILAGCTSEAAGVYTLYRSSPADAGMRIHVATFNAAEGDSYNRDNCEIAAGLFGERPGIVVRYWCEPGIFQRANSN